MKSYETARNHFSFLGFCAGVLIALGVVVALMGGSATQFFAGNAGAAQFILGAIPGIMMATVGVIGQAMVQMGRASVDTAEFTQQSLDVSRKHIGLSKQQLEQGKTTAASSTSLNVLRSAPSIDTLSDPVEGASYGNQHPMRQRSQQSPQWRLRQNGPVAFSCRPRCSFGHFPFEDDGAFPAYC